MGHRCPVPGHRPCPCLLLEVSIVYVGVLHKKNCRSDPSMAFVDSGSLHLLGPTSLDAQQTCVSGQQCTIRYSGNMLVAAGGGLLQILDTCSMASFIPGFIASVATDVSSSGAIFSWGSDIISAAAGSFRLCWCAADFDCGASDHFRVDLGELFILGPPSIDLQRTCISGLTCSWSVPVRPGEGHGSIGQLMITQTCGTRHQRGRPSVGWWHLGQS